MFLSSVTVMSVVGCGGGDESTITVPEATIDYVELKNQRQNAENFTVGDQISATVKDSSGNILTEVEEVWLLNGQEIAPPKGNEITNSMFKKELQVCAENNTGSICSESVLVHANMSAGFKSNHIYFNF